MYFKFITHVSRVHMKHNWCSTIRDKTISLCRCSI